MLDVVEILRRYRPAFFPLDGLGQFLWLIPFFLRALLTYVPNVFASSAMASLL